MDISNNINLLRHKFDTSKNPAFFDVSNLCLKDKFWWKCKNGHSWLANLGARLYQKHGCPDCKGNKLTYEKSLAYCFPGLLNEWSDRNINQPSEYSKGHKKNVWWKCKHNHEWQATIANRTRGGTRCPICNKGRHTSIPEQTIYFYLSKVVKCENDYKFNNKSIDIYIPSLLVAIEYDGLYYHKNNISRDNNKTNYLMNNGVDVVRIREAGLTDVKDCINIFRDASSDFISIKKVVERLIDYINVKHNLRIDYPEMDYSNDKEHILEYLNNRESKDSIQNDDMLLTQWDYEKNNRSPQSYCRTSPERVWWKCDKGHSWQKSIKSRTSGLGNCPFCNSILAYQHNNLFLTHNHLVSEWDDKNTLDPSKLLANSRKVVMWTCSDNHTWKDSVFNRALHNKQCPYCIGVRCNGSNSLYNKYSEIVDLYWCYDLNTVLPTEVMPASRTEVYYRNKKGVVKYGRVKDLLHVIKSHIKNLDKLNGVKPI